MPTAPQPRKRPWATTAPTANQGRAERTKEYDSPRWRKMRKWFLSENPLCVECEAEGRITPANVVDHKIQVRAGADFWDVSNWQALCTSHHNKKSARERHNS